MPRRRAFRRTRAACPADVAQRPALADQLLEVRPHELPCAHILRLFLQPDDVPGRRVGVEYGAQSDIGEWGQLLDAANRDVLRRLARLAANEIDVHLPAAQHDAANALRASSCLLVIEDRLEAASLELDWRRGDRGMTQQALRRQHEQRERILSEQLCLSAQQMEVLRGRG